MERYWKVLDLDNGVYSIHETEEEVNHIIDYLTKDMDEDKCIRRSDIETSYSNYDFQYILVIDSHKVRRFLYFFDYNEEECDSLEERIEEMQARHDMECDKMKRGLEHTINEQASLILILHAKLHESEESNQLDNKNAELEDKLIRYAGEIEDLKYENSNLRKELKSALESLHDQYDDDDKPCCKNCVHCRPFIGSTDCYCSQTCEVIKNEHAETYYCKNMIPYEDDYPF